MLLSRFQHSDLVGACGDFVCQWFCHAAYCWCSMIPAWTVVCVSMVVIGEPGHHASGAEIYRSQTASNKRRSIRHDNEFSNEILVHEFCLGTAKVRELVNAAHDRLKLAFFNQANDATKIATRSLA